MLARAGSCSRGAGAVDATAGTAGPAASAIGATVCWTAPPSALRRRGSFPHGRRGAERRRTRGVLSGRLQRAARRRQPPTPRPCRAARHAPRAGTSAQHASTASTTTALKGAVEAPSDGCPLPPSPRGIPRSKPRLVLRRTETSQASRSYPAAGDPKAAQLQGFMWTGRPTAGVGSRSAGRASSTWNMSIGSGSPRNRHAPRSSGRSPRQAARRTRRADGRGHHDLGAVGREADARGGVDGEADVAGVRELGRPRWRPIRSRTSPPPGQARAPHLALDRERGLDRRRRVLEHGEDVVSACGDLVAAGAAHGGPHQAANVGQERGVVGVEPRRAARSSPRCRSAGR